MRRPDHVAVATSSFGQPRARALVNHDEAFGALAEEREEGEGQAASLHYRSVHRSPPACRLLHCTPVTGHRIKRGPSPCGVCHFHELSPQWWRYFFLVRHTASLCCCEPQQLSTEERFHNRVSHERILPSQVLESRYPRQAGPSSLSVGGGKQPEGGALDALLG